ncbi:U4/U6-U5 snRNP complex subunit LSM8 [Thecaphora frezii]
MSALYGYVDQQVLIVTQDGRVIVGTLKGSDSAGSIILAGSVERIFSPDAGVEEVPLGLYILRGDSICLVGDLDVEKDRSMDLAQILADPIPETRHTL